jgi:hypothetical protein
MPISLVVNYPSEDYEYIVIPELNLIFSLNGDLQLHRALQNQMFGHVHICAAEVMFFDSFNTLAVYILEN